MFHVERCDAVVADIAAGTQQAGATAAIKVTPRLELQYVRPRGQEAPSAARRGRRCGRTEVDDNPTARRRCYTARSAGAAEGQRRRSGCGRCFSPLEHGQTL